MRGERGRDAHSINARADGFLCAAPQKTLAHRARSHTQTTGRDGRISLRPWGRGERGSRGARGGGANSERARATMGCAGADFFGPGRERAPRCARAVWGVCVGGAGGAGGERPTHNGHSSESEIDERARARKKTSLPDAAHDASHTCERAPPPLLPPHSHAPSAPLGPAPSPLSLPVSLRLPSRRGRGRLSRAEQSRERGARRGTPNCVCSSPGFPSLTPI